MCSYTLEYPSIIPVRMFMENGKRTAVEIRIEWFPSETLKPKSNGVSILHELLNLPKLDTRRKWKEPGNSRDGTLFAV